MNPGGVRRVAGRLALIWAMAIPAMIAQQAGQENAPPCCHGPAGKKQKRSSSGPVAKNMPFGTEQIYVYIYIIIIIYT
jgi:hypothetical protein